MASFFWQFTNTAWYLFKDLWYWAIIGTVLATVVTRFISVQTLQRQFQRSTVTSVGVATMAGSALPLCACGVIPFLVSFLRIGAPLAVTMAFTAASPLMDPADFAITAGMLGLNWAVVKTLAAIAMGMLIGSTVLYQNRRGVWLNQVKVRAAPKPTEDEGSLVRAKRIQKVLHKFLADLWFSGKFLLLAIILGALLNTFIPSTVVTRILGGHHWYGTILGSFVGMTTYGVSDAPIIKVLLGLGMSKGAGMSFLIAGHATSIGLLATLHTLVKRPLFIFYLIATLVVSLVFGFLFQLL